LAENTVALVISSEVVVALVFSVAMVSLDCSSALEIRFQV